MNETAIWTIGHSTHPLERFVELLRAHGIEAVADVRRHPGSKRNPQYGAQALPAALGDAGIGYVAFVDLGGRRAPHADSANSAWRNDAFRGYADYMDTPAYENARARLLALARERRTALMCAEGLWWQCHRALISDDLKSRGVVVHHIAPDARVSEHPYTQAARIVEGRLVYGRGEALL